MSVNAGGAAGGGSTGAGAGGAGAAGAGAGTAGNGAAAAVSAGAAGAGSGGDGKGGANTGAAAGSSNSGNTAGTSPDWTGSLNEDFRGFVQNKGWKDPGQVVDSYRNLEKLLGAPQNEVIRMPKEDDAAGWDGVYSRLGRPATPADYKLETPKEGGNPEFTKFASEMFHKQGLNEKQAKGLVDQWNGYMQQQTEGLQTAAAAKLKTETDALRKEWGAAHDQNMNIAKRAAREFGVDPSVVDALEKSGGFAAVMKTFHNIGSRMGEANFVSGNQGGGQGIPTPEQARSQINALKADPGFSKKYIEGDVKSRQQMEMLHKYAYPESA